ncbi:hypothetical protein I552_5037 [Mycobacterium xenopi 3993]|nr:hypothetical protein I552_5037 [Mycobacterium xenopi 3993]
MDLIADLLAAHVDIDAITGLLDDGPPRVRTSPAGWANSSAAVANTPSRIRVGQCGEYGS